MRASIPTLDGKNIKYVLSLYVTGMTERPQDAIRNIRKIATRSSRDGTNLRSLTFTSNRSSQERSRS